MVNATQTSNLFMVETSQFPINPHETRACGIAKALHQLGAPAQAAHGQVHGMSEGLGAQAGS